MKTWIAACLAVSAMLQLARPSRIDIQAAGTVDVLRQTSDNTCWATVATMLARWRDQKPYTVEEVMTLAGPHHLAAFKSDQGLEAAGKDDFLASLGLMAEVPQDFTIAGWGDLLEQYGPLWVTLQSGRFFSVHAVVVIGISGDGTPNGTVFQVIDPAVGIKRPISVQKLMDSYDAVARGDMGKKGKGDFRPQVVHVRAKRKTVVQAASDDSPVLRIQTGHTYSFVHDIALARSGAAFATTDGRSIKVWDTKRGALLQSFDGALNSSRRLAISADAQYVVASAGSHLTVWRLSNRDRPLHSVDAKCPVDDLTFRSDGVDVVFGCDDYQLGVLNAQTGQVRFIPVRDVAAGAADANLPMSRGAATAVAVSSDGNLAAVTMGDGILRLVDVNTHAVREVPLAQGPLTCVAFSPVGRRVVVGAASTLTLYVVDADRGTVVAMRDRTPPGGLLGFHQVKWTEQGILTRGGLAKGIGLVDAATLDEAGEFDKQPAGPPIFDAGSGVLVTGASNTMYGATLVGTRLATRAVAFTIEGRPRQSVPAFSPDGKTMASSTADFVTLWDLEQGLVRCTLRTAQTGPLELTGIGGVAINGDGSALLAARGNGQVEIWNVRTCQLMRTLVVSPVHANAAWADPQTVVIGGHDGDAFIAVASIGEASPPKRFSLGPQGDPRALAVTRDVAVLAGGVIGSVVARSLKDGSIRWSIRPSEYPLIALSLSEKAGLVAMIHRDGKMRSARLRDGVEVKAPVAVQSPPVLFDPGIAIDSSGQFVARVLGQETQVWIRSLHDDREWAMAVDAGVGCQRVAFHPSGDYLAVGCPDGTLRFVATRPDSHSLTGTGVFSWGDGRGLAFAERTGQFDTMPLEEIPDVHWTFPDQPLVARPSEIFLREFYEPRLLPRLLTGGRLPEVRPLTTVKRVQPLVSIESVAWEDQARGRARVSVKVSRGSELAPRNGRESLVTTDVYDLRLFRDGKLVRWEPPGSLTWERERPSSGTADLSADLLQWRTLTHVPLKADGTETYTFSVQVPRQAGTRPIAFSAYAFNDERVKSATATAPLPAPIGLKERRGRAYVIAVGVNRTESSPAWDLSYAVNDARRLSTVLQARLEASGQFETVVPIRLVSDHQALQAGEGSATQRDLLTVLDLLAGRPVQADRLARVPGASHVQRAEPEDLVVLSVSSHGYTDARGVFHFVLADIGANQSGGVTDALDARSLSSDTLSAALREIDAGELVLIVDACQSEATVQADGFKPGPMGSRGLGQLAYDKGMRILAASKAKESAIERGGSIQQGLLTYALVQRGLDEGAADFRPRNGTIDLGEWLAYAVQEVPALFREGEVRGSVTVAATGTRDAYHGSKRTPPKYQQPVLFDYARPQAQAISLGPAR